MADYILQLTTGDDYAIGVGVGSTEAWDRASFGWLLQAAGPAYRHPRYESHFVWLYVG